MGESPNWLELPHELTENILQRLPTAEILNSARKVCTNWRIICKDPAIWKVISMENLVVDDWEGNHDLEMMTEQAVDLSCGELIDISIEGFGTDRLLEYIVIRSNKLKCLSLTSCYDITGSWLSEAVSWVPQLEELHISDTYIDVQYIDVIGQNCPQLKSFTMNKEFRRPHNNDDALAIANNMPELRHLQVIGNKMSNYGLNAILDGCPHLESLDLRMCCYVLVVGYLGKLCKERIKDLKRPNYSMENSRFRQLHPDHDLVYLSGYSDNDDGAYMEGYFSDVGFLYKEDDDD